MNITEENKRHLETCRDEKETEELIDADRYDELTRELFKVDIDKWKELSENMPKIDKKIVDDLKVSMRKAMGSELLKITDSIPKLMYNRITECLEILPSIVLSQMSKLQVNISKNIAMYIKESISTINFEEISVMVATNSFSKLAESIPKINMRAYERLKSCMPKLQYAVNEETMKSIEKFQTIINSIEIDDEVYAKIWADYKEECTEVLYDESENKEDKGIQERFANKVEYLKKKYFILYILVVFFISNFIRPIADDIFFQPIRNRIKSVIVREFPQKDSDKVGELKEDDNAVILENVPYYYKVLYIDEEGNVRQGYVSKRNVKPIDMVEDE